MAQKVRIHLPVVLAVIFTIAILFGSFFWFSHHTDEMIEGTTKFYLETNARSQAAAFNTKLANQVEMLQTVSRIFKFIDMTNPKVVRAKKQQFGDFPYSAAITVPPMSAVYFEVRKYKQRTRN